EASHWAEWGSTGRPEMSAFHTSSAGKSGHADAPGTGVDARTGRATHTRGTSPAPATSRIVSLSRVTPSSSRLVEARERLELPARRARRPPASGNGGDRYRGCRRSCLPSHCPCVRELGVTNEYRGGGDGRGKRGRRE